MGTTSLETLGVLGQSLAPIYTMYETERNKKKAKKEEIAIKNETQKAIDERKNKIEGMKTRLFENKNSIFGEEVLDSEIKGV